MPTAKDDILPVLATETSLQRLQVAAALCRSAWERKLAWLRRRLPVLSEAKVKKRGRDIFLHASG